MNIFQEILSKEEKIENQPVEEVPEVINGQEAIVIPKVLDFFDPDSKDERGIPLHYLDPRSDLTEDHEDWVLLLNNALLLSEIPEKLYETLHWIRCSGGGLEKVNNDMGLKLIPGQWDSVSPGIQWDEVKKKFLEPMRNDLIKLLQYSKKLGKLPHPSEIWGNNEANNHQGNEQGKLIFGETDPNKYRKRKK